MKPIIINTKDPIIFVGDVHGNWATLKNFIRNNKFKGTIIQCGDAGIGFHGWKNSLYELNSTLALYGCTLYIFRGNHDNPFFFRQEYNNTHIYLVNDYQIFEIDDEHLLTIGGACSIDRSMRIMNDRSNAQRWAAGIVKDLYESYWIDELFVYDKEIIEQLLNTYNIKYIATHSICMECPPLGIEAPIVQNWAKADKNLKADLIIERNNISALYNQLKSKTNIKEWIYAHFHNSQQTIIDNTKFVLLDCDEIYELNPSYLSQ